MSRRPPEIIAAEAEVMEARVVALQKAVQDALDARDMAAASVELALQKCLVAGQHLKAQRGDTLYGEWYTWLAANVRGKDGKPLTPETARKWIKLAEFAEHHSIENANSIRQAYILAGLLPEADPSQGGGRGGSTGDALSHLERAQEALLADLKTRPLSSRSAEDRHILRARLLPFVKAYEALEDAA